MVATYARWVPIYDEYFMSIECPPTQYRSLSGETKSDPNIIPDTPEESILDNLLISSYENFFRFVLISNKFLGKLN